jgi:hypothetical protein
MKIARLLTVTVLTALLAACLLSPGRFTSAMDLRRDGRFTFSYDGQIYLLALSKLAEMGAKAEAEGDFVEQPCFGDEGMEERECTVEELARQKKAWE